jgi:hypothetical protein
MMTSQCITDGVVSLAPSTSIAPSSLYTVPVSNGTYNVRGRTHHARRHVVRQPQLGLPPDDLVHERVGVRACVRARDPVPALLEQRAVEGHLARAQVARDALPGRPARGHVPQGGQQVERRVLAWRDELHEDVGELEDGREVAGLGSVAI